MRIEDNVIRNDDGLIAVVATKTPHGYRWYSSIYMRNGTKNNFPTARAALLAAAKSIGLPIDKEPT
jgi:hypothetical protein